jgi:hypothetical protein
MHVSFGLNNFYLIEDWTVDTHNSTHASDLNWLNSTVNAISTQEPNRKVIMLELQLQ